MAQSCPAPHHTLITLSTLGVLVGATAGLAYFQIPRPEPAVAQTMGAATISSRPEGAEVTVDGLVRGFTPIRLSLPVGQHVLEITSGTAKHSLPLTIETGALVSQYVELTPETTVSSGRLEVTSDPSGAQVRIDGALRGTTPLALEEIDAGEHAVAISSGDTIINRSVKITPGTTASVVASIQVGTTAGWVAFKAPIGLQVFEKGGLVGSTDTDRLMLSAGRHELELANGSLEFRAAVTVQIIAGKTSTITVPLPNGSLSINALPWAEVWIDGRAVGSTPLGNLPVSIGSHEIVWRHPQLGERRRALTVTASSPVRVGMDFSK